VQVAVGGGLRVVGGGLCALIAHHERDIPTAAAGNHELYSPQCVEEAFSKARGTWRLVQECLSAVYLRDFATSPVHCPPSLYAPEGIEGGTALESKRRRQETISIYRCAREGCGCEITLTRPPSSGDVLPSFYCCAGPMKEVLEKPEDGHTAKEESSSAPLSSVIPFPRAEGSNLRSL
jgi:hypothetical protein